MYNNYLPQQYNNRQQNYYPQQQHSNDEIKIVNGIRSAEQYSMYPNSRVILLDSEIDRFYIKETDAAGMAKITAYDFTIVDDNKPTQIDYITREEFNKWKEEYELNFKKQPTERQSVQKQDSIKF